MIYVRKEVILGGGAIGTVYCGVGNGGMLAAWTCASAGWPLALLATRVASALRPVQAFLQPHGSLLLGLTAGSAPPSSQSLRTDGACHAGSHRPHSAGPVA